MKIKYVQNIQKKLVLFQVFVNLSQWRDQLHFEDHLAIPYIWLEILKDVLVD